MKPVFAGFLAGVVAACSTWAALVRDRGALAAEIPAAAPAADPSAPDLAERAALEARLAAAHRTLAAAGAPPSRREEKPFTDADVMRWLTRALSGDGPMTFDAARQERWINALLEWWALERGIAQEDLEFAPLRERFVVRWLEERGRPLDAEQRRRFEEFLAEAEGSFGRHMAGTAGWLLEDKMISGLQRTADWGKRFDALLTDGQRAELAPLQVLLEQWRWEPSCEPRAVDLEGDMDAALEAARANLNPGDYDRIRGILVDHVKACATMHREVKKKRLVEPSAVSDREEFVEFLKIRAATRRRLMEEAGLPADCIRNEFLYDYCADRESAQDDAER
jgi:hypothetical protein